MTTQTAPPPPPSPPRPPPPTYKQDMTTLNYLNEPGVLWNLKVRYQQDDIYTYTGSILIAVNPFTPMPHLYGSHMMGQYRDINLGELSPHVYAIADASYRQMRREKKSQSILISGESGAGKTETSKLIMQYLAWMGGRLTDDDEAVNNSSTSNAHGQRQKENVRSVEQQVLESNPLLEAFGNAKTVRNDNSSRFGKFTEIQFDSKGRICGAAIRTYLLERSRVAAVNDPERNYHIFYQLCDGATAEERQSFKLKPASEYRYLNQSSCYVLDGVSNAEEYVRTRHAMDVVGIPQKKQEAVFSAVAAVLHLGNIEFTAEEEEEEEAVVTSRCEEHLIAASELLSVQVDGLRKALTTRTRQTPDGPIVSPLDAVAAAANRDALAKTLYSRLFDWIVSEINTAIGQSPHAERLIGVLDIYGFEQFATNDFEQFCINLANEKLQQHFNAHVFKQEQAEYEREAIDWSYIEFVDNQDVLDLIEGKLGIIDLLDETCRFPKATHGDLAQKLYSAESVSGSQRFSRPKLAQSDFTISHYAGAVTYKTAHFLDKNRDFIVAEHQELLGGSRDEFVQNLFLREVPDGSGSAQRPGAQSAYKFSSVGARFKKQLGELMEALRAMEPHYVRCIKPNGANRPMIFEAPGVLHQLRCGGVLEAVRISCAGYPSKVPYGEFADHFWPLAVNLLNADDKKLTDHVVGEVLAHDGAQYGKTKLFLRAGKMALLEKRRTEVLNSAATKIQKYVRGWLALQNFRRMVAAIVALQAGARGMAARRIARGIRQNKAATIVQKQWRSCVARQNFRRAIRAVTVIQAAFRGYKARCYFDAMRQHDAATSIQAAWRGSRQRQQYVQYRKGVVAAQCAWRARLAKKELRRRRTEARETGKLMQDKQTLEKSLKEIKSVLENVKSQRNELRQALREEKALRESAERSTAEMEASISRRVGAAEAAAATALASVVAARQAAESELSTVQASLSALDKSKIDQQQAFAGQVAFLKAKIAGLEKEKNEVENSARAQVEDLMTRLNNAIEQRNAAREEAVMAEARTKELQEAVDSGRIKSAHLIAASPGMNEEEGMMDRVKRYMNAVPGGSPSIPSHVGDGISEMDRRQKELFAKQQQLLREQRAADQERLLTAIKEDLGFDNGRPVAAVMIFRSILQWKTLQADRTQLFDKIIASIGSAVEAKQEDNVSLAYWLSNTVTLFYLMQKNTKPPNAGGYAARLRAQSQQVTRGLLGNASLGAIFGVRSPGPPLPPSPGGSEASIHGGAAGGFRQVEVKYPALLFKQQLDAFVQKIFPMLRDNVKKCISPQLSACIHAPRLHGSAAGRGRGVRSPTASSAEPNTLSPHWAEILKEFESLLATLKENHVPSFLIRKLFEQLFSFVNVQLFNQLLLRRECCSFSNGEYVKTGLAEVERWAVSAGRQWVGDSWEALAHIRQAVTFLVIHQKHKKTLPEISGELCPVLSVQQLYRISTMYWDDRYGTETVSHEVLSAMKEQMVLNASNAAASHSFLLDDDATIPFTHDDVSSLMEGASSAHLLGEMSIPASLKEQPSFNFLQKRLDAPTPLVLQP